MGSRLRLKAGVNETLGLIEILNSTYNGKCDLARIAREHNLQIDEILHVVDTANTLGFINVVDGDLIITEAGKKLLDNDITGKKKLIKSHLKKTKIFRILLTELEKLNERRLSHESLVKIFQTIFPDGEGYLRTVLFWGQFAELIGYDEVSDEIYLLEGLRKKRVER